jgi:hypothetical protein
VADTERLHKSPGFPVDEKETPGFEKDNVTTRQSALTATPRWRVSLGLETYADPSAQKNALAC